MPAHKPEYALSEERWAEVQRILPQLAAVEGVALHDPAELLQLLAKWWHYLGGGANLRLERLKLERAQLAAAKASAEAATTAADDAIVAKDAEIRGAEGAARPR